MLSQRKALATSMMADEQLRCMYITLSNAKSDRLMSICTTLFTLPSQCWHAVPCKPLHKSLRCNIKNVQTCCEAHHTKSGEHHHSSRQVKIALISSHLLLSTRPTEKSRGLGGLSCHSLCHLREKLPIVREWVPCRFLSPGR